MIYKLCLTLNETQIENILIEHFSKKFGISTIRGDYIFKFLELSSVNPNNKLQMDYKA